MKPSENSHSMSQTTERPSNISTIFFKKKRIVHVKYTHCVTEQDLLQVLKESEDYVRKSSVNILMLVTTPLSVKGTKEYMREVRRVRKEVFNKKVDRWAITGLNGFNKVLLKSFNMTAQKKILHFEKEEQALDYLVSD